MLGTILLGVICVAVGMYIQKNKDQNGGNFNFA